jgi:hypothetical protein
MRLVARSIIPKRRCDEMKLMISKVTVLSIVRRKCRIIITVLEAK